MSVAVTMEGTEQIAEVVRKAMMRMNLAGGMVEVVAGGKRGTAKNTLIARVQASRKRNPWFIDHDTLAKVKDIVKTLALQQAAFGLGRNFASSGFYKQIGDLLVESVKKNILAQRNVDGTTFRELANRYAAFKRRKHGFIHPILKATGDLMDGIHAVVTKGLSA